MAKELCLPIDPLDRLPLEIWNDRIFPLVPHLSRLQCRCVNSKWYHVLKAQELAALAKPAPAWCLTIAAHVADVIHWSGEELRIEAGPLYCTAISPSGGVVPLPQLTFPSDWRPEENGGGFRSGGGLVAYFCDGYYRVGNPLHNMWEMVKAEVSTLPFKRQSFELVVDERAGSYEIVAYGINERIPVKIHDFRKPVPPCEDRDHDNWAIQVYSSKTRSWRRGATLDRQVFICLIDVCVFERTVYFLGWIVCNPTFEFTRFENPHLLELDIDHVQNLTHKWKIHQFKKERQVSIWAYNLDNDNLREAVPPAQYYGGKNWNFPQADEHYVRAIELHVSRQPGREVGSLSSPEFSLVVPVKVCASNNSVGSFWEKLYRLRLNEEDPLLRYWVTDDVVGLDELVAGGPRGALVADTWGVKVVAYEGYDLFCPGTLDEVPDPWNTLRILCYQRDEQKLVDWYGYAPDHEVPARVTAVGFVACGCCVELERDRFFDNLRSIPMRGDDSD